MQESDVDSSVEPDAYGRTGQSYVCFACNGSGTEYGETCLTCGGFGWCREETHDYD